jgi:AcrR family transcriptional regulator
VTAPATGVYRGVPAEERRAERRERLLDAAFELLGTKGAQATTVRGVCAAARLTPRYFYESFAELDALLVAVFDRMFEEATAKVLAAMEAAPPDPRARSRAAIETFVTFLTDDPRRARIAFVEGLGNEPVMRRRLDGMRLFAGLVAAEARALYQPPPEADGLVDITATMLVGGMAELLITWVDGSLAVSREQLIDDVSELFFATGESAIRIAARRGLRATGAG